MKIVEESVTVWKESLIWGRLIIFCFLWKEISEFYIPLIFVD